MHHASPSTKPSTGRFPTAEPASSLPTGTVTFLFTDIEGSTRLLAELGDRYGDVLAKHRRLLREAFAAHGGVEVDTQGDAFFVAFARASDAIAAAEEAQAALSTGPVRVRMGLHTGEPTLRDEGYVGVDVHRGARIAAAGHGGQVLLSESTRSLVDEDVRDLGEHRLKDLLEPQRLFQLGGGEFPSPNSLNWTNLPVQATPLVGRERELAEAAELLRGHRLLTLVGPPGTGKTRLALQLAAEVSDAFDHVWWVPLQELRDPELVEPTIAQTVGARTDLAGFLGSRRALLVLDNVEHVMGCAPRLAQLVGSAGSIRLVATSREPLHLTAEQQYPVPPLAADEAVALFRERARAVRPDFTGNGAVTAICGRLDGLPLAIELAAARVKLLHPEALLARLEQRLPLLTGGARDLPERQQTLRATIAWSYDLLEPGEQQLLAQLSVFAGGWMLEDAEAVCECELETLASLVDKSLVRERDGRFTMLETIREFALERLEERGDADGCRRRHAEHFLRSAQEKSSDRRLLFSEAPRTVVDWFAREHDNLRAAVDWLHEGAQPELELRLVIACWKHWARQGHWSEGRRRTEAALERATEVAPALLARATWCASTFTWRQGDYERARSLAERALALYGDAGTSGVEVVRAHIEVAICESHLGNFERAIEIYEQATALARELGDEGAAAVIINNLGNIALTERDFPRAQRYFEESLSISRRAVALEITANNLIDLGFLALAQDRFDDASATLRESLSICRAEDQQELLVWALEGLAAVSGARNAPARAARLLATTTRLRDELALGDYYPTGDEVRERTLAVAREQLGAGEFAAAWTEGSDLSPEAAAEEAALVD